MSQCFYADQFNCQCTNLNVNGGGGKVNCPSPASLKNAREKNIANSEERRGHLFALPMHNDSDGINWNLRKTLLIGSGIKVESSKYNEKMELTDDQESFKRKITMCKCHIDDDDIIAGVQKATLALKKTATIKSTNY